MIPDLTIKNYYLQFIYKAKENAKEYENELNDTIKLKDNTYDYLLENIDIIEEIFNIDLTMFNEFNNQEYNNTEKLYNTANKKLNNIDDDNENRIYLFQIIKYCNVLRKENKLRISIKLTETRKNISFRQYQNYIRDYYNKVHECVLKGMGYKFSNGIGTYLINHWIMDKNKMKHKKRIDYVATYKRKKELLEKGVKLYDDKEAIWYAARNIPYKAVDYRVYQERTDWYEFTFIDSKIFGKYNLEYKKTEYVATKYRGMNYEQMANELCKTEEDIYNLQVDIKYKLNILLYKYPNKYLNYVRNSTQCKYDRWANNR